LGMEAPQELDDDDYDPVSFHRKDDVPDIVYGVPACDVRERNSTRTQTHARYKAAWKASWRKVSAVMRFKDAGITRRSSIVSAQQQLASSL
jgi:hypothetical protein